MTGTTQPDRPPFDAVAAAAWIEATCRNSNLAFDPTALPDVARQLAETVERDAAGKLVYVDAAPFKIVAGEVVDIPVEQHVGALLQAHTKPVAPKQSASTAQGAPAPAAPSSAPQWAKRGTGPISDFARALAEKEDAAWVRESESWPNPWLPANLNRTRQQVLINKNPALAQRHRAQAGL